MMKLAARITKLEAVKAGRSHLRLVERHVIGDASHAERQARIKAVVAASSGGNVFHVFRVIVEPIEEGATSNEPRPCETAGEIGGQARPG